MFQGKLSILFSKGIIGLFSLFILAGCGFKTYLADQPAFSVIKVSGDYRLANLFEAKLLQTLTLRKSAGRTLLLRIKQAQKTTVVTQEKTSSRIVKTMTIKGEVLNHGKVEKTFEIIDETPISIPTNSDENAYATHYSKSDNLLNEIDQLVIKVINKL